MVMAGPIFISTLQGCFADRKQAPHWHQIALTFTVSHQIITREGLDPQVVPSLPWRCDIAQYRRGIAFLYLKITMVEQTIQ
jgi:hypothetical protein